MIHLKDLRDATGGQMFGDVHATQFKRFSTDPRAIRPGDLFVAAGVDSDKAIEIAIRNGSVGILVEDPPTVLTDTQTVVMVGDARAAMGQWAAYVLRQFGTTVIGVFAAVGASTIQSAIAAVLAVQYRVFSYTHRVDETETPFALPDAVQSLTAEHEILIMPLLGQRPTHLADVIAAAQPLVNVIGRLTPIEPISEAELSRLQSLANVVVDQLPAVGRAVVNADDYIAQEALNRGILAPSVLFGQVSDIYADIKAVDIEWQPNRSSFVLSLNDQTYPDIEINVPGPFGIDAAVSVCEDLDEVDPFDTVPFRVVIVPGDDVVFIGVWLFSDTVIHHDAPIFRLDLTNIRFHRQPQVFACLGFFRQKALNPIMTRTIQQPQ